MEEQQNKIFRFEADDIKGHIRYEMKLMRKMGKSFDYIHDMLTKLNYHKEYKAADTIKLENLKYDEGKNYNWIAITCGRVKLILRVYGGHFTIFCRNETVHQFEKMSYTEKRYSAFTFYVDTKKVPEDKRDYYHEHSFEDLNNAMPEMIKMIAEDKVCSFWNNYSLKRPDHCEIKNVFDGEDIVSVDKLIFCAEELSSEHLSLFAQNDMLEILKSLKDKVGQPFDGRHTIKKITTEFSKQYSDPYYHGVGITVVDEKGKTDFHDVYCLSHWYMEAVENLMKL